MHSNPFPSSPSHATQPLELVHSDLHGPLPVRTREGYRYWMTFIDDATSHCAAMQLKRKSDAFEAFKTYKAFAENHFQTKMKELQEENTCPMHLSNSQMNVGSTGAIPHATDPSRMVLQREQIALWQMISQPCSLRQNCHLHFGEKVSVPIHVWNCLPTSSLKGTTPY